MPNIVCGPEKKAKSSTAYHAAGTYLEAAESLLLPIDWDSDLTLALDLYKELAACQYLMGNLSKAETLFNLLLSKANTKVETVLIYKLYCEMLATHNKHEEAIQIGLKALKSAGINLPNKPSILNIMYAIFKIKKNLGWKNANEVELSPITDPEYRAIINLISQLFNSAFIINQHLFLLLVATNINLSLEHGVTDSTGFACVVYAFCIMHTLHWYHEGLRFVELYQKLSQQNSSSSFIGRSFFVLATFIYPWCEPIRKACDTEAIAYQYSYEQGDLAYCNYSNNLKVILHFFSGTPLPEILKYTQSALGFIERIKTNDFKNLMIFYEASIKCLCNESSSSERWDETTRFYEKKIIASKNITELAFFYSHATRMAYLLEDYERCQYYGDEHEKLANYELGMVSALEALVYHALGITNSINNEKEMTHHQASIVKKALRNVKRWASWHPENYDAYRFLLNAEMARLKKKWMNAIQFYNKAIDASKAQGYVHLTGIINRCAGHLYQAMNIPDYAKMHFTNAYDAFKARGAILKCRLVESRDLSNIPRATSSLLTMQEKLSKKQIKLDSVDILSVLKATQAISSEIRLEKLLQSLLFILLQNAGAQRGVLMMKEGEEWYVEAEGSLSAQRVILTKTENLKKRNDLPLSLIGYVQRTKEKLLIQSKQEFEKHFIEDIYLKEVSPQSVLIIPINFQGQLRCLLYLENRDVSYTFAESSVEIVQMLAAQATISLENAHLYYQATHDPLTGLANRNLLYQSFTPAVVKAKRTHKMIGIMFIDVDDFKKINDTLGHEVGDSVLVSFAQHIKACLRDCDLAARLGGDEFIIMLEEVTDLNQIKLIAERFLHELTRPIRVQNHHFNLTLSIGISVYPENGDDIPDLIKQADIALYRVKATGKGRYQFYTDEINKQLREEHTRELELYDALENHQFLIHYQPVYRVDTKTISHFEALLRWQHPTLGLLRAEQFINLAEKSGLIYAIGEWVLKTICQQLKTWQAQHLNIVPIAMNITGPQCGHARFYQLLEEQIRVEGINPELLELELTERMFINRSAELLDAINMIKKLNVKLSIDDFGTYYSSLAYLKHLPIDVLKIDRSFIMDISGDEGSYAIIKAIVVMAHTLNLKVTAEGVETAEQLNVLELAGVDEVQGYYLNAPMRNDKCALLL